MFSRYLEFYSLDTEGIDFCTILKDIHKKPNKDSKDGGRILKLGSHGEISLIEFKEDNDFCDGLIARSQKEDLPIVGNLFTRFFHLIGLGKDDGIIDMTYFCYIKKLNVLCLLPAKKGVKWGTFKFYIQTLHQLKDNFEIYPLLTKRAFEKYNHMGSITLVDAILDIGNNAQPTSKIFQETSLGELIKEAKNSNATRLKLEIYNEKKQGGLVLNSTKKFIDVLKKLGVLYEAESLKVKGSPSADKNDEIIDLIKDKYKLPIQLGSSSRSIKFDECLKKVHESINGNFEEIEELVQ